MTPRAGCNSAQVNFEVAEEQKKKGWQPFARSRRCYLRFCRVLRNAAHLSHEIRNLLLQLI